MKDDHDQMILTHRGSGSGGYLEHVFRAAAKELFDVQINDEPLEFKVVKYDVPLPPGELADECFSKESRFP